MTFLSAHRYVSHYIVMLNDRNMLKYNEIRERLSFGMLIVIYSLVIRKRVNNDAYTDS